MKTKDSINCTKDLKKTEQTQEVLTTVSIINYFTFLVFLTGVFI